MLCNNRQLIQIFFTGSLSPEPRCSDNVSSINSSIQIRNICPNRQKECSFWLEDTLYICCIVFPVWKINQPFVLTKLSFPLLRFVRHCLTNSIYYTILQILVEVYVGCF